ncbi:MAG: Zn-dependent hydrolase [Anaerolineae bacterium]|nr:Zn-dependent hydrolase [Anaerolineae bacterium]NUQ04314.1 Zn-dependent hydrolase [Anaerolineae bacterium]
MTTAQVNAQRTVDELKELRALTGTEDGAQRVAFTDTWAKANDWYKSKLTGLPVEVETDEAGNLWTTLRGASDKTLILGGHLDSVPNGGWLDGCLNVMAGLEVLRRFAAEGVPPVTIRVVSWADEEGARFGRSLFGSSACSGTMNPDDLRHLKDRDGVLLVDALARFGIDLDKAKESGKQLKDAAAYLELHIEQGPVLESMDLPLGVVLGTFGVERHSIRFTGQAAHSGSTPMDKRRDALAAAAKLALEIRPIAVRNGGVCTCGRVDTAPGIVTSVVAQCDITLDQRHLDADKLAAMYREAREASERFAEEEKCGVEWRKLWDIHPILFHPQLIDFCDQAILETCGVSHRLPSGPLHDAAEVARAGVPTIMMFVQSLYGISHNKIEDTKEEHIRLSVEALDRLASKAAAWILSR